MTRRELLATEIREAGRAFLRGHDTDVLHHLRTAAALAEGLQGGLT